MAYGVDKRIGTSRGVAERRLCPQQKLLMHTADAWTQAVTYKPVNVTSCAVYAIPASVFSTTCLHLLL
jgi:hypothetical protein